MAVLRKHDAGQADRGPAANRGVFAGTVHAVLATPRLQARPRSLTTPRLRRLAPWAALTAVITLAAGCGTEARTSSGGAAAALPAMTTNAELAAAGRQTAKVTSGRFALRTSISFGNATGADDGSSRDLTWNPSGEFDGTRTRFTSSDGALFGTVSDVTEVIRDGETIYLRQPSGWGRLDASQLDGGQGIAASLGAVGSDWGQVARVFTVLSSATDRIDDLGQEELRGTVTQHRAFGVDPAAFATLFASMLGFDVEPGATLDGLERDVVTRALGEEPAEVEGWFDAQGVVRKLTFRLESPLVTADEALELWDPGQPIDIAVPADARPLTLRDLTGGR